MLTCHDHAVNKKTMVQEQVWVARLFGWYPRPVLEIMLPASPLCYFHSSSYCSEIISNTYLRLTVTWVELQKTDIHFSTLSALSELFLGFLQSSRKFLFYLRVSFLTFFIELANDTIFIIIDEEKPLVYGKNCCPATTATSFLSLL